MESFQVYGFCLPFVTFFLKNFQCGPFCRSNRATHPLPDDVGRGTIGEAMSEWLLVL